MTVREYNNIISYFEDFKVHDCELEKLSTFEFVAPSSLHSGITTYAYGKALSRECVDIGNRGFLTAKTDIRECDVKGRRFLLKITACLENWEIFYNDIKITVNSKPLYRNERELFENVNLGWPSVYYAVPEEFMNIGENTVYIETANKSGAGLYISAVSFVSLPEIPLNAQISSRRTARAGERYNIVFNCESNEYKVLETENCRIVSERFSQLFPNQLIIEAVSDKVGEARLVLRLGNETAKAFMPDIVPASEDICLIGMDSDDNRQDMSLEADRILETFALCAFGDFLSFKPQMPRNHLDFPDRSVWEKRIDYLKSFGVKLSINDVMNYFPYFAELAGENYIGKHIHEPYLFFSTSIEDRSKEIAQRLLIDKKALEASESFGESKNQYIKALEIIKNRDDDGHSLLSVGSPSLLCVYEAATGFDRNTMEPVSNVNLLCSAIRASAKNIWGAHIPIDWYLGEPNNFVKSRKFLLCMQYLYLNGASYLYTENALFKTNAFSREDWESSFCADNRRYLRNFYDYAKANPREGELVVENAVVYGNNEYFFWHSDDRIAELYETNN